MPTKNQIQANPPTVQAFLALYGYPNSAAVQAILAKYGNGKNTFVKGGPSFLEVVVTRNASVAQGNNINGAVCMILARGMLYTTGSQCCDSPCPGSGSVAVNKSPQIIGAVTGAGLATLPAIGLGTVAGIGAGGFAAAGTLASAILGPATLGIGLLIGPLLGIIEHHAQAVATEDSTICGVANAVNQVIPQIDTAVASGTITAQQGISAMQSLVAQMSTALNKIAGPGDATHPCNAGCVWISLLKTHLDFAGQFYMDLSPLIPPAAPGAYTPQAASAGVIAAQVDNNPNQATPMYAGSPSASPNAPGTGTFTSAKIIPVNGTGSAVYSTAPPPSVVSSPASSPNWAMLFFFGIVALVGGIALSKFA